MTVLGNELRRLRRHRQLRQRDVANALGIGAVSAVSAWESGTREVSREHWAALAKVLGVTTEHLRQFGGPYDPSAPRVTRRQRATAPAPDGGDILQQIDAMGADGPEMQRLVGSRGMATVWSLIAVLEEHRDSGEELNVTIEQFLTDIRKTLQHTPPNHKRNRA